MAYPTKYTRQYDFLSYQNANPTRPLPGDKINADYNFAQQSIDEIVEFLKGFSRADGSLANESVGVDQLSPAVLALIATGGEDISLPASVITYDNGTSGLSAGTVQDAIDELATSGGGAVDSVFGRTGTVVAVAGDYDFTQLGDVPSSYSGQAFKTAIVNSAENALIFSDPLAVNVKDFGAVGDTNATGSTGTDDTAAIQAAVDYCFGTSGSPHSANAHLNRRLYFPPGRYKVTAAILIPNVRSACIFGAGMFASYIVTTSTTAPIFTMNGYEYGLIADLAFVGATTTPRLIDFTWDGVGGAAAHQNTEFARCFFGSAAIGVDISRTGSSSQGSEMMFHKCVVRDCTTAGLKTSNANALQTSVVGGNYSHCGIGIYQTSGSFPLIAGVGFQNNTVDVQADNSSSERDIINLFGCRTESQDFFWAKNNPVPVNIIGCSQANTTPGMFCDARAGGQTTLKACVSQAGTVRIPQGMIEQCRFDSAAPFDTTFNNSTDQLDIIKTWINSKGTFIPRRTYTQISAGVVATANYNAPMVRAIPAGATLTVAQSGFIITNEGASARSDFVLPTAAAGLIYEFEVEDADGIRVTAASGDTIRLGPNVSTTAGRIDSTTIGSRVILKSLNATEWFASSYGGTWSIDGGTAVTGLTTADIGVTVQAYDADLTTWASLTPSANAQALVTAADYSAMRTLLGLVIGTNVQAYDADLTTWAGLTPSANAQSLVTAVDYSAMRTLLGLVIGTNVQAYDADLTTWASLTPSANAQSLVTAANYSAMRTLLSLVPGTDVQAYDAELAALAGVTSAADKVPYFTGSGTATVADLTSVARTLIAQTTQALMRTTGLGMSSNGSSLVSAADYAAMKVLLNLVIGTNVQAWDADLDSWAAVTRASGFDTFTATPSVANLKALLSDDPLTSDIGGTGNAFTKFTGPATSEKTFTLPNSSQIIAVLDLEDQTLTGGARVTSKSLGTVSSGTTTLDPGDRPLQDYTNGGAHTLAPGSNTGSILLDIVNNGSAGAITTSGWTKVAGDSFTTTNGHKFRCHCSIGANGSVLIVQAMQ